MIDVKHVVTPIMVNTISPSIYFFIPDHCIQNYDVTQLYLITV